MTSLCPLLIAALPVHADDVTSEILAYDRLAYVIVFTDRTVWERDALLMPGDLTAGDVVTLKCAGDSGIGRANGLTRAE